MSGLTDEEKELKRLAEGADKEKWRTYSQDRRYVENENGDSIAEAFVGSGSGYAARVANAEYIAAADPATVLRLLARIEELEATVAVAQDNGLERAARAVESAPASFNRNDLAERIRKMKSNREP